MSFYAGVVPADGLSAQAGVNWSPHQQTIPTQSPPTSARTVSVSAPNSSTYAAPVTPAQAYARSVVSGQPVLHYTIQRKQPGQTPGQQPAPLLQSTAEASASTRGQSYAQRLYASSLGKQPQAQTTLQTSNRRSSSGRGESPDNRVPAGPRPPHGARASLILNTASNTAPQAVSALDFYHSSVSKLEFQSPVPDRGTSSPRARRPQSASSASSTSAAHSSVPIQAPYGLQAPVRRGPVPVELSNVPPQSPAGDLQWSSQAGSRSRSPPNPTPVMPRNAIVSPVLPETPLREFSPYSEDHAGDSAQVVVIYSSPEPATQESHPLPASVRAESPHIGGSEEVPLYSLVDDEPPPPDFDESIGSATTASVYHTEAPIVLAPPDVHLPTSHEFDAVFGAVPSAGADTPSIVEAPRPLSPEPLSGSPRISLAMPEVQSYSLGKAPVDVKENSHGHSAEDSMPRFSEKSQSYPSMEASSSSRTLSEGLPSYKQPTHKATPQDISPVSPAVPTRNDTSARASSTAPLPALPPRRSVASTLVPIATSAPSMIPPPPHPASPRASAVNPVEVRPVPLTMSPPPPHPLSQRASAVSPVEVRPVPLTMSPPPPHPLSQRASAVSPVEVRPVPLTMSPPPRHPLSQRASAVSPVEARPVPLRPGSGRQPSNPPLPPRVRAEPTFPPPSMYHAASPSPPLHSPPSTLHSQGPSVLSSSTGSFPAAFRPQLSPDVSPALQGQVPHQSPRQSSQRPAEFGHQLSPALSPTPQGYVQVPYQSPGQSFQPQTSPPPPPQQPRAQNVPAQPVQSSRGLGNLAAGIAGRAFGVPAQPAQSSRGFGTNIVAGIAGGALGLLGGAVLAETLGDGDIADNITGSMDGMTFGDPTEGLFDPNMGTGDMLGSGFDPTANYGGDQTFVGDSFDPTANYGGDQTFVGDSFDPTANYGGDQTFVGDSFDPTANYGGDQTFVGDSFDPTANYGGDQTFVGDTFDPTANYVGDQPFTGDSFGSTYDMADQTMGDGVDPSQFQGQAPYYVSEQYQETQEITITQTFDESQSEQQPNDQSSGTHYMHDAGRILQAAYKRYNATQQQNGAAQGSQGSQTMSLLQQTPHPGRPPNSPPVGHAPMSSTGIYPGAQTSSASVPFHGASFTHSAASGYPSPIQQHGQSTHLMAQHHSSVNPASQQGTHPLSHHHASPQSSHPQSSHTQSPYMNHVTYPSFGTATHTMSSQAAQYAVNNGASPHGTATHHYSPQSQADGRYSAHPSQYLAQGHPQQSPAAQQPPSAGAGLNKTMIAKQFVKGALMAGGVLAKYNRLTGGNGN